MSHEQASAAVSAVRQGLTRNLGKTQADTFETMRERVDALMGFDHDSWKELHLYQFVQDVLFRATNRIPVGLPLCHDEGYLDSLNKFPISLGAGAIIIGQFVPWFLTPFLGHVASIPVRVYRRKSLKYLLPEVEKRVEALRQTGYVDSGESKDLITWAILASQDKSPLGIADTILFLTLGAVHTIIITATNTFLDLLSSPPECHYFEKIREEAASTFQSKDDWGNLASLSKLKLTDSAIRESLRMNPPVGRVAMRQVMHKDGLTLPEGYHLPQNAWLGVSVIGINRDDEFYTEPDQYSPFRFAKTGSARPSDTNTDSVDAGTKKTEREGAYLAQAEESFMAWGYGRHSCPGRWFAAHTLKLMVAYITLKYDIEPLESRPVNGNFGDSIVPSRSVTIKVRRRKNM